MASMTAHELVRDDGFTPEQARREMDRRVFGHDVKYDRHGKPIEQGIGSPSQPTEQHFQMLAKHEGAEVAAKARADAIKAGTFPPKPRPEPEVS